MCGIVGIWDQSNSYDGEVLSRELNNSVETLKHRGPDDNGTWVNESGVGLGHTRLSILDLSSRGHQPMVSANGRFVIVYNGEVYNFTEIRDKLSNLGHTFRGCGDTEVILASFQEWGDAAVQQFIGMFAIALWDNQEKNLRLFRDRLGVKPLYYAWDGKRFWFGSELKAIRPFQAWQLDLDTQSVGEFLQYGYIAAPRTVYRQVKKLPPGHRLLIANGREPAIDCYWNITDVIDSRFDGNDEHLELELEALLANAFSYRMVSDVPVGVFLSGGVDSSLVAAILAKHHPQTIHTFTIGFGESSHDESRWARKVASHIGTEHTEYILAGTEALQIAKKWGTLFDEPFGDSSGIPTLLVSQMASQEVKVVLSADGGDELFSGYHVYESFLRGYKRLERIPSLLTRPLSAALQTIPIERLRSLMSSVGFSEPTSGKLSYRLGRYRKMLRDPSAGALYDLYLTKWLPEDISRLLGSYSPPRRRSDSYPGDLSQQMSLCDVEHYLPDDILAKVDRTTMLTSIEGREPLLDHRLAEFAFRLPPHLKRGELGSKHILKKILYKHVPREFVDRPKQGFAIPLDKWLRGDLRELVNDYLSPDRIRQAGIFDPTVIEQTTKRFLGGDDLLTTQLWFTLAFEMWREEWQ
jgi:asparagine synthase (glutamine-hydrolysing)